jgi:hypothetical protein
MISPGGWKERHKDEDVVPPKKPLPYHTRAEMVVGRMTAAKAALRLSHEEYEKFVRWKADWIPPR